ncbi:MAG: PDZ domain-containing protein [Kofleriaceae bacterium]
MPLRRLLILGALCLAQASALAQEAPRPWLGLLRPRQGVFGVQIVEVYEDSGAASAGLTVGDELLYVDDVPVSSVGELVAVIQQHAVGDRVAVRAIRNGVEVSVVVPLGAQVNDREMLHSRLVGKRAPSARLRRVDDDRVLDPCVLRGKVVVLAWFTTRCDACSAMIAKLASWTDGGRDATLLAVTSAEPALLASYLSRNPLSLPLAVADEDDFSKYAVLGGLVDNAVSFVVIDRNGVVRTAAAVEVPSADAPPAADAPTVDDVIARARQLLRAPR